MNELSLLEKCLSEFRIIEQGTRAAFNKGYIEVVPVQGRI